jgi:hypothetical protein
MATAQGLARRGPMLGGYRVVFLLGAGASVAAGVPTAIKFVVDFAESIKSDVALSGALEELRRLSVAWVAEEPATRQFDIESLYETLESIESRGQSLLDYSRTPPIERDVAHSLLERLREFIVDRMFVATENVRHLSPIVDLVGSGSPIDVFTTNYDTSIELACDRRRIRWEDGFGLYWDASMFKKSSVELRLVKLHGSVLWYVDDFGNYLRSPIRPTPGARPKMYSGDAHPLLMYPARKQVYEAPYVAGLDRLRSCLGPRDEHVMLVVIGYSFRDEHILQVLLDSARVNRALRVVVLDPRSWLIVAKRLEVIRTPVGAERPSPLRGRSHPICGLADERTIRRVVSQNCHHVARVGVAWTKSGSAVAPGSDAAMRIATDALHIRSYSLVREHGAGRLKDGNRPVHPIAG